MMILSFAQTTPALLAGEKTVTRRDWTESHARRFRRGDLVQAWDKSPRAHGKRVATIRLTGEPYQERAQNIPSLDWWGEGLDYMHRLGYPEAKQIWDGWRRDNPLLWVVRFELVLIEGEERP